MGLAPRAVTRYAPPHAGLASAAKVFGVRY